MIGRRRRRRRRRGPDTCSSPPWHSQLSEQEGGASCRRRGELGCHTLPTIPPIDVDTLILPILLIYRTTLFQIWVYRSTLLSCRAAACPPACPASSRWLCRGAGAGLCQLLAPAAPPPPASSPVAPESSAASVQWDAGKINRLQWVLLVWFGMHLTVGKCKHTGKIPDKETIMDWLLWFWFLR